MYVLVQLFSHLKVKRTALILTEQNKYEKITKFHFFIDKCRKMYQTACKISKFCCCKAKQ
jgi:hypothetical protein